MVTTPRRRLWGALVIALGLILLVAGGAVWYGSPPPLEAYALLKVSSKPPRILHDRSLDDDEFSVFKRTQVQLLLSNMVLNGVLRDEAVSKLDFVTRPGADPVSELKERLEIDYPEDAEILRVALAGSDEDELKAIVNKVVDVYLKEIVQRDIQLRQQNEAKLQAAYERQMAEYQRQMDALKALETIHKTSGSEAAELQKMIAKEELQNFLAQRRQLLERIQEAALEIKLHEARGKAPQETHTADQPGSDDPPETDEKDAQTPRAENPGEAATDAPAVPPVDPALRILEAKREFLEEQYTLADAKVGQLVDSLAGLETFSATVNAKREEIAAIRETNNRLRSELDRIAIERLAPDRITLVEEASVSPADRYLAYQIAAGGLAVLGLGSVVFGAVLRRRAR